MPCEAMAHKQVNECGEFGTKLRHSIGANWAQAHEVNFKSSTCSFNFNLNFPNSEIGHLKLRLWVTGVEGQVGHVWNTLTVHTIEFQKCGLPHMHLLILLHPDDKICNADQVNSIMSAEIPDPNLHPLLYETITTCMLHGPCGNNKPNAPCMVNGQCSKHFPNMSFLTTNISLLVMLRLGPEPWSKAQGSPSHHKPSSRASMAHSSGFSIFRLWAKAQASALFSVLKSS